MAKTPSWYYDNGHRYKPRQFAVKFKVECVKCGAGSDALTVTERRKRAGMAIRVCIDRQACLFAEWSGREPYESLGWTPPHHWATPLRTKS